MSEELASIQEQALVSVLAAAKEQGVNLGQLYDRACALNEQEGSGVFSLDSRHTGDVALVISLAIHKAQGHK
ncbi:hypothetical protein D3C77_336430 [compost metagenome]